MLLESSSLSRFIHSFRSIALLDVSLPLSVDSHILLIVLVSSFTKKPPLLEFVSNLVEFIPDDIEQELVIIDHVKADETLHLPIDIEEQLLPLAEMIPILERKIPEASSL